MNANDVILWATSGDFAVPRWAVILGVAGLVVAPVDRIVREWRVARLTRLWGRANDLSHSTVRELSSVYREQLGDTRRERDQALAELARMPGRNGKGQFAKRRAG